MKQLKKCLREGCKKMHGNLKFCSNKCSLLAVHEKGKKDGHPWRQGMKGVFINL